MGFRQRQGRIQDVLEQPVRDCVRYRGCQTHAAREGFSADSRSAPDKEVAPNANTLSSTHLLFALTALSAADAPRWSVQELALQATGAYTNPWLDTAISAEFRGPGGENVVVKGFWDGGQTFRIRWTPTASGRWTWSTRSNDQGLNGKTGFFNCTQAGADSRGFLRKDAEHPYSFVFDDGTRYFLFGNTFYGLVANAMAGGGWKHAVDRTRAKGMNKIRFAVSRRDLNAPVMPANKIDLPLYQKVDEAIRYLAERNIIADLILFQRDRVNALSLEEASQHLKYMITRYAAYPNVIWCLQNEWEYTKQPKQYWSKLGELASRDDPWTRRGAYVRALSIHQQTRYDWQFFGENWYSHAIIQLGVRNQGKALRGGDEWNLPRGKRAVFPHGDDWVTSASLTTGAAKCRWSTTSTVTSANRRTRPKRGKPAPRLSGIHVRSIAARCGVSMLPAVTVPRAIRTSTRTGDHTFRLTGTTSPNGTT